MYMHLRTHMCMHSVNVLEHVLAHVQEHTLMFLVCMSFHVLIIYVFKYTCVENA